MQTCQSNVNRNKTLYMVTYSNIMKKKTKKFILLFVFYLIISYNTNRI